MKNLIIVFIISYSIPLFTQEMAYEKFQFDFTGVLVAENKLVAYGNSGHVLVSSDNGISWNSVKIFDDSISIEKLILSKGSIYGICYDGIIFKTDLNFNLTLWSKNNNSNKYYDFTTNEKSFFLSSNSSIKVLNDNFEQVNEVLIDSSYSI